MRRRASTHWFRSVAILGIQQRLAVCLTPNRTSFNHKWLVSSRDCVPAGDDGREDRHRRRAARLFEKGDYDSCPAEVNSQSWRSRCKSSKRYNNIVEGSA